MSSVFERNPKKTIFGLIIILFFGLDIVLSKIYRNIQEKREQVALAIKHPIYHHDFEKNGHSKESGRLGDYEIFTNSLGFKDKSIRKISRNSDNRRIVFIGDSFTEGVLLNYQDTFVGIIDSVVSEMGVEILNAGKVSYSPIIYWRKIKYLLEDVKLKFDELIVFIDISDMDDEASYFELSPEGNVIDQVNSEPKNVYEPRDYGINWLISNKKIDDIRLFVKHNFLMISGILNWLHDLTLKDSHEIVKLESDSTISVDENSDKSEIENTWEIVLNDRRANWTIDDKYYQEYGDRGKERMIKYMDKLAESTKKYDIDLTVVVYPWPSQVWYDDLNSIHVEIWREWSNNNNINFINLFPAFIESNMTEPDKLEIINKYYVPYDLHYNREGNKLVAEEFLKYYFQTPIN